MSGYSGIRGSVIDAVRVLSDPAYQRKMWVEERGSDPRLIEDLDANISTLYDDTGVAESPHDYVGTVLRSEEEARAIAALDRVLTPLLEALPAGADDASVIAMPEWRRVVEAAREALDVLTAGSP